MPGLRFSPFLLKQRSAGGAAGQRGGTWARPEEAERAWIKAPRSAVVRSSRPVAAMARAALLLAAVLVAVLSLTLAAEPRKRPRLLGGLEEADVSEEGVQRALNFALSEYNKASNDRFHSRARQVLRARKQLVAGMNYFLEVEIGRTTCTKSQPNLADCPFHEEPHLKRNSVCSFQIYTVPWEGKIFLTKSSCRDA
ncbi:PREDICTED: cystatin-C [Chinchilla lanigera]|uniref:cystatin-C n=1 Tax=Chinchilla lanigera TaxID=34839 RepID=UPI00038E9C1E|nr:PREDICTED: cystatin-C [Chinchilla lanigera]